MKSGLFENEQQAVARTVVPRKNMAASTERA
jgi:hypothetical protein